MTVRSDVEIDFSEAFRSVDEFGEALNAVIEQAAATLQDGIASALAELDVSSLAESLQAQIEAVDPAALSESISSSIEEAGATEITIENVDGDAISEAITDALGDTDTEVEIDNVSADSVGEAITEAAAAADVEVEIESVEAGSIGDAIGDAIGSADTEVEIESVDAGSVADAIGAAVGDADAEVTIENVDAGSVGDAIGDAIGDVDAEVEVEVGSVDVESIGDAITDAASAADAEVEIASVEAGAVGDAIDSAIASVDTDVEVEVASVEAGAIGDAIDAALGAADTDVEIGAVDAGSVGDAIVAAVGDADTEVTIANVDADRVEDVLTSTVEGVNAEITVDNVDASAVVDEIDSALGDVDTEIDVFGNADDLQAEVAAALVADAIDIDGDTSELVAAIESLSADAIVVDVDADTGNFEQAISEVTGDTAGDVGQLSEGFDKAGNAAVDAGQGAAAAGSGFNALRVAQQSASGQGGALASTLSGLGGTVGKLAGGGLALAGTFGILFKEAFQARQAQDRLNIAFGDTAAAVQRINVGGLRGDLSALAISIGSSDERLKFAISNIGTLGKASGASSDRVVKFSQNVAALSLRAVALNPALGQAGDVADKMVRTLGRGGPIATKFGISLASAEIKQRADEMGLAVTDLDAFTKAEIGATIVTEKLGGKLGKDFSDGASTAAARLKSFKARLGEAIEAAGGPLVDPVTDSLEALVPAGESAARVLGTLATALGPIIATLAPGFASGLGGIAKGLEIVMSPLQLFADLVELIPAPVTKAIGIFLGLKVGMALVGAAAVRIAPLVIGAFGSMGAAALSFGATVRAGIATALGPWGLAISVIAGLAVALGVFGGSSRNAAAEAKAFDDAIFDGARTIEEVRKALDNLNASFAKYLETTADLGKESALIRSQMVALGITNQDLAKGITGTTAEFEALVDVLTAGLPDDPLMNLAGAAREELEQERELANERAKAQIAALQRNGELTKSEAEHGIKLATVRGEDTNYTRALEIATAAADKRAAAERRQHAALSEAKPILADQAQAWVDLAGAVIAGTVTLENAEQIAKDFGLGDPTNVTSFITAVNTAITQFAADVISTFPTGASVIGEFAQGASAAMSKYEEAVASAGPASQEAKTAFDALSEASNPQKLVDNLNKQADAIAGFPLRVQALIQSGNTALAAEVTKLGPTDGGTLAAKFLDDPSAASAANGALLRIQGATQDAHAYLLGPGRVLVAQGAVGIAQGATAAYGANLDWGSATNLAVQSTKTLMAQSTPQMQLQARLAASFTGQSFHDALVAQMTLGAQGGVTGAQGAIIEGGPPMAESSRSVGASSALTFAAGIGGMGGAAARATIGAGQGVTGNTPAVTNPAGQAGAKAAAALNENMVGLYDIAYLAFGQAGNAIVAQAISIAIFAGSAGLGAGSAFATGVANGMTQPGPLANIREHARTLVREAEAEVRRESGSHSPSKLFAKIGRDFALGLAEGFGNQAEVKAVARTAVADLADVFRDTSFLLPKDAVFRNSFAGLAGAIDGIKAKARTYGVTIRQLQQENRQWLRFESESIQKFDRDIARASQAIKKLAIQHDFAQAARAHEAENEALSPEQKDSLKARNDLLKASEDANLKTLQDGLARREKEVDKAKKKLEKLTDKALEARNKKIQKLLDNLNAARAAKGLGALDEALKGVIGEADSFTSQARLNAVRGIQQIVHAADVADQHATKTLQRIAKRQEKRTDVTADKLENQTERYEKMLDELAALNDKGQIDLNIPQWSAVDVVDGREFTGVSRPVRDPTVDRVGDDPRRSSVPKNIDQINKAFLKLQESLYATGTASDATKGALFKLVASLPTRNMKNATVTAFGEVERRAFVHGIRSEIAGAAIQNLREIVSGGADNAARIADRARVDFRAHTEAVVAGFDRVATRLVAPLQAERIVAAEAPVSRSTTSTVTVDVRIAVTGSVDPDEAEVVGAAAADAIESRLTAAGIISSTRARA